MTLIKFFVYLAIELFILVGLLLFMFRGETFNVIQNEFAEQNSALEFCLFISWIVFVAIVYAIE